LDVLNDLQSKSTQLKALMLMTYGHAADSFNNLADEYRDNYLWHCSVVVDEIAQLVESLVPATVQVQPRLQSN
jgi:hypothetical protein